MPLSKPVLFMAKYRLRHMLIVVCFACVVFAYIAHRKRQYSAFKTHVLIYDTRESLSCIGEKMRWYALNNPPRKWHDFHEIKGDITPMPDDCICPEFLSFGKSSPIQSEKDPWGSEIVISKGHQHNEWTLKSLGPNRRDDGGCGDDIEVHVTCTNWPK